MEHRRGRIGRDRLARLDAGGMPPLSFDIADHRHVIGEDAAEAGIGEQAIALFSRQRRGIGLVFERQAHAFPRLRPA